MKQLEENVLHSFKLVKRDIIQLQSEMIKIYERQEALFKIIDEIVSKKQPVTAKKSSSKKKKVFVASKTGKKFHVAECPFAKNIKPKSKVTFHSKDAMLNNGYKPCSCIN